MHFLHCVQMHVNPVHGTRGLDGSIPSIDMQQE